MLITKNEGRTVYLHTGERDQANLTSQLIDYIRSHNKQRLILQLLTSTSLNTLISMSHYYGIKETTIINE